MPRWLSSFLPSSQVDSGAPHAPSPLTGQTACAVCPSGLTAVAHFASGPPHGPSPPQAGANRWSGLASRPPSPRASCRTTGWGYESTLSTPSQARDPSSLLRSYAETRGFIVCGRRPQISSERSEDFDRPRAGFRPAGGWISFSYEQCVEE